MTVTDIVALAGGLALLLYGMNIMGTGLEKMSGSHLERVLERLTSNRFLGFLLGIGVTAIIQSSSATTVMVVGFVNSGIMKLSQSVGVIMGANIGTTVTAWILSLTGIQGDSLALSLLKPDSLAPICAFAGIILFLFIKRRKSNDLGSVLLGFALLLFGMTMMSSAVEPLQNEPWFAKMFTLFTNPFLGVLVGAVLTAIIQSSSASVGVLQAMSASGLIRFSAVIPIICGQNIGTCVTALLSSVGTSKNARRAALVHLSFNVIGASVWLAVFCLIRALFAPVLLTQSADYMGIAVFHSVFNILCTALMLPMSGLLEKMVCRLIPDSKQPEKTEELDERLLSSPALALEQCRRVLEGMARCAVEALRRSMACVLSYDSAAAEDIRRAEGETDRLEDALGSYMVKLTGCQLGEDESTRATEYMKLIGDYERIADHAVNILESAEELRDKELRFSAPAEAEYRKLRAAVEEILTLSYLAFSRKDTAAARQTEPLEQVIDDLKETLRTRHILRLQRGECSAAAGFVWSDLLTDLERVADHCSNISGCVLDTAEHNMNIHENQRALRGSSEGYRQAYAAFRQKYSAG